MLFKYEYLDDASSPGQLSASAPSYEQLSSNATDLANQYKQQSHVIDVDADYDLTPKLGIGGKFGFRLGELEDTTVNDPQWFASQAWLAVARVDYHILKQWDITTEFHYLDVQEAGDANYGALIGVYRYINKNTKVGVGYNFSDFSDDITDLSYKSRGFYFDVLGEF
jgi:opacity protein-like surface antigen